jgi:hypothetical protein
MNRDQLLTALTPLIVTVLIPLVMSQAKKLIPESWKPLIPTLAVALGPLADLAISWLTGKAADPALGLLYGGAAVALREIVDQVKKAVNAPLVKLAVLVTVGLLALGACTLSTPIEGKSSAERISDALRCYDGMKSNTLMVAKMRVELGPEPTTSQKIAFVEQLSAAEIPRSSADACAAAIANALAARAVREKAQPVKP